MQREQPGREVDLIAHSQGGVVVDLFLEQYRASDPTLPPIGNVITLSSPHQGAPLATSAEQLRASRVGKELIDAVSDVFTHVPPGNSTAVRQLSERSAIIRDIQRHGVPEHIDFTSIGATEDYVVPATNISLHGATETTVAVNAVRSEHKAIVEDPNALRAVRAALEGRAPPCLDLLTALRGAVVPVVVSRASHLVGDPPATALVGAP
jgi:triacylglycerol esterase/lipase EstA (alpha/beta hydrolase family)